MTEQEQRAKFKQGRPLYSDEETFAKNASGETVVIPDSSSRAFLKQAKLQENDTNANVFVGDNRQFHKSAEVFFPKGALTNGS